MIKYNRSLNIFMFLLIIVFIFLGDKVKSKYSTCDLGNSIVLQPDQLKIKEGFGHGEAKIGNDKILISLPVSQELEAALNKNKTVILTNLVGQTQEIEPATNFGQFDYRKFYASEHIYERVILKNYQILPKKRNLIDYFHGLRNQLKNFCLQLPRLVGFMTSEMLLAENLDSKNQTILDSYRNLGVIHLLSISGLHVGLYTTFISIICTLLKRDEYQTFLICILVLGIEIALADFQAGFVRASLGFFLGKIFSLKNIPLTRGDRLGLVALIHLFIKPRLFFNCGAILSYLLVLGLELIGEKGAIKQGLLLNLLITPILLNNFYQFNALSLLFNFIIVPIFNFCLLPLTLIGVITFKLCPGLTFFIEKIFHIVMELMEKLARTNLGIINFGKINWWQTILLLLLSLVIIIYSHKKQQKRLFYLSLLMTYVVIFVSIHFPLYGRVSIIDVGQGDSILVTTPFKRKAYLIDTGGKVNFGKKKSSPQINRITLPYLYAQGIDHLDAVFLSHQDADHIGDLGPLLDQVPVRKLYFAQGLNENPSFIKRINGKVKHTKLVPLLAGDVVKNKDITFHVMYPFLPGTGKNEDSLSLYFNLGGKSWLFTGDLDQEGEKKLIQQFPIQVDYFKLGHHGSKTSSNPEFLKTINPRLVFISAGRNNRFGHPHLETLQTLESLKIPYYATQDSGTITWTYYPLNRQNKFTTFNQGSLHGIN
ncbi:DNA internalization-related competence protein ComEC/Rec2 [Lactobacillus sp. PV034]|uniref:DNA internalization-related competence protein ComEC/Rec2 n=1 Tax=Lactobacillus sp. PV034 TaxID=2594495 RepID=UPI003A0FF87A